MRVPNPSTWRFCHFLVRGFIEPELTGYLPEWKDVAVTCRSAPNSQDRSREPFDFGFEFVRFVLPYPAPTSSMSFEDLQSAYIQKVGIAGCMAFFSGDYKKAAHCFRIIEAVVPEWRGYAEGALRDGKAFRSARLPQIVLLH